ncbi:MULTISPECIES: hypothetical protein [unclassified Frankia]|uniref:hypothetical protein n=1 Tax=unclassified Frankia TaxID=2632575 RepID=UPI002AD2B1C1|nr:MULTISPECIES: hypothetical protein [unclassified Frankia]
MGVGLVDRLHFTGFLAGGACVLVISLSRTADTGTQDGQVDGGGTDLLADQTLACGAIVRLCPRRVAGHHLRGRLLPAAAAAPV